MGQCSNCGTDIPSHHGVGSTCPGCGGVIAGYQGESILNEPVVNQSEVDRKNRKLFWIITIVVISTVILFLVGRYVRNQAIHNYLQMQEQQSG